MKEVRTTDITPARCPFCGYLVEQASCAQGDYAPMPGDVMVCHDCAGVLEWTASMSLAPLDPSQLGADLAATVAKLRKIILDRKRAGVA